MQNAMPLDAGTLFVISRLRAAGYEANVVGGSVRNHLLGIPVTDVDITTSALPEQTKATFPELRIIETGIKHGTVTVLVDGAPYEITTYRTDGEYLDNRHPASVEFTASLREDLARRDFTVNAICYNPEDGFTDLFDGIGDIEKRLIRAVGDPVQRFNEDALRILRAIRFASVLGFSIEAGTSAAIRDTRHLLANVSRERVYVEWQKLLGGERAYDIITEYPEVICAAIPTLDTIRLPDKARFLAADAKTRQLALFCLSTPDPVRDFDAAMTDLHTDNLTRNVGCAALRLLPSLRFTSPAQIAEAIYDHGEPAVRQTALLGICLGLYDGEGMQALDATLASDTVTTLSQLAVGGRDIAALGLRGVAIGKMLDYLIRAVIYGRAPNEREALMGYARENIEQSN